MTDWVTFRNHLFPISLIAIAKAYINDSAEYNIEAVDNESIPGGPQRVVYAPEKKFEILQSYEFTSEESTLIGITLKYHIQSCHRQIAE